jgi:hypothetical protein
VKMARRARDIEYRDFGYRKIGRLLRTGLLILAIVLQGYITQLHHHDFAAATLAASQGGDTSSAPISPVDGDGRDHRCFICHLSGLGANSVAPPSIPLATAPIGFVACGIDHDPFVPHGTPAAYASRAPPSLTVPA